MATRQAQRTNSAVVAVDFIMMGLTGCLWAEPWGVDVKRCGILILMEPPKASTADPREASLKVQPGVTQFLLTRRHRSPLTHLSMTHTVVRRSFDVTMADSVTKASTKDRASPPRKTAAHAGDATKSTTRSSLSQTTHKRQPHQIGLFFVWSGRFWTCCPRKLSGNEVPRRCEMVL